ncbi:FAD/NAD(P)-binding protein [Streptococcus parauberis]|uniref:FAD/NAD(P)-binding protein n=1 Tax=Streptococcus parauberis TaxID=1348 RepID=UPI00020CBCCE|nr:FAD/NAD(P)-binding protein [Streptococcus parauberis]AEF25991.1 exported protein [Streptococcus parauberis KCTC 11537]UWM90836.1 FAD/NAD(P)-binding protein [Streptococcus parauberis]GAJ61302.1 exported protein [Streptococcus parauberis]
MTKKIAIIGMGVSGLAVLLAISQQTKEYLQSIEISCFDDSEHFGRGIPFQEDDDSALINSPLDDISFDYHQMMDFMDWLKENKYDTSVTYTSRTLYGRYMKERAHQLITQLPVTIIKEPVESISYSPLTQTFQLTLTNTRSPQIFDHVHLACGVLPVADPYQLTGHSSYIADPYPIQKELATKSWDNKDVAIIGTGLAAVDVIKWLLLRTTVTIKAFSRSNYFPTVRITQGPDITWHHLTDQTIQTLIDSKSVSYQELDQLFQKELQALGFSNWEKTKNEFLSEGIAGIKLSLDMAEHLYHLQQLASRLVDCLTDLWPLMSPADRHSYQENYGKPIVNLRNPMPEESAQAILEAAAQSRLKIISDVEEIKVQGAQFLVGQELLVDKVINATGYQLTEKTVKQAIPLLQSILKQELAQIDKLGGLSVNPETMQVMSPRYGAIPTLFAHGALVNGVIYQNNSTIKIQKMAERGVVYCNI